MTDTMMWIAVFLNTRQVIKADTLCKRENYPSRIIPVPTKISSECGMCIEIEYHFLEQFTALMKENEIDVKLYARDKI